MAYQIQFSETALTDLDEIMGRAEIEHSGTAEQFGTSMLNHAELLREFPYLGAPTIQKRRRLLHWPFYIYYSVDEARKLVEIERFWHAKRRLPKLTRR